LIGAQDDRCAILLLFEAKHLVDLDDHRASLGSFIGGDATADKFLDDLLARVLDARDVAAQIHGRKPVFLKIAPDLALDEPQLKTALVH
jgi:hypothetical protein